MVIENTNSYTQNTLSIYKNTTSNTRQGTLQKQTNIDKLINTTSQRLCNIDAKKIKLLTDELHISVEGETQVQSGMSFLQEKDTCLCTIKAAGEKLEELSKQYKSSTLSEEDKLKIEGQAEKILKGINHLMDQNSSKSNSTIDFKTISVTDSKGNVSTVSSESFSLTLEPENLKDTNLSDTTEKNAFSSSHFKNNISTKTLLENTSIIEDQLLTPTKKAIEDVHTAKSTIYHTFVDDYGTAKFSIKKLHDLGQIDDFIAQLKLKFQDSLCSSISALCFQSSNIDKDNVCELLN
jgi:hypothetical protein